MGQGCGGAEGASSADRATVSPSRVPQTLAEGRALCRFAEQSSRRIFIIFSGDLSHRHGNQKVPVRNGTPDPMFMNPKYPDAVPEAAKYDEVIGNWAATLEADLLLH